MREIGPADNLSEGAREPEVTLGPSSPPGEVLPPRPLAETQHGSIPPAGLSETSRAAAGGAHTPGPVGWPDALWQRYTPVAALGSGGMGRVFKAWDPRLRRHVAIKLLKEADPELVQRFLREAQAQARIEHPNICKVFEVGEADGHPFIAMQLIDGVSVAAADGLSQLQKVLIVKQIAEAVHAAHRVGLIHRDLKPANVMIEATEAGETRPYVVDFGLVRELGAEGQTVDGTAVGTPAFMAPEQARGDALVDRRADVWGLGATLYWLLSGSFPIRGHSPMELLLNVASSEPVPLGTATENVPRDLQTIVMKCLERDPARRYDSARALAEDLARFMDGDPIAARPPSLAYRLGKRIRKHWGVVAVGATGLLVATALLGMWVQTRRTAARQAELAQRFGQKVEQVEGMLWRARSLEAVDTRPVKALVRQRLEEIREEMSDQTAAAGPGHAALGRGLLALEDLDGARRELEAAWNGGYRPPAVAYDLGLTLGQLYQRELQALGRIADKDARQARRRRLDTELRDPTLVYLRATAGHDLATPEYVRALLAFYEGNHEQALALARLAFEKVPWLYEAKALEGDVLAEAADQAVSRGDEEVAWRATQEADVAYRQATHIGRSDPRLWADLCALWAAWQHHQVWDRGHTGTEFFERANQACSSGLRADPTQPALHLALAQILFDQAELRVRRGADPDPNLQPAIAAARAVLALQPRHPEALCILSSIYWQQGKYLINAGKDPRPSLDLAIDAARQAAAADPGQPSAHSALGNALLDRAVYEEDLKADPRPFLDEAIAAFERSGGLLPNPSRSLVNQGMCYWLWVTYLSRIEGGDPTAVADKGFAVLRRAAELNPSSAYVFRTLGSIQTALAEWQRIRGHDPRPLVAEGIATLEHGFSLNPTDLVFPVFLFDAHFTRAEYEVDKGLDPTASFRKAREVAAHLGTMGITQNLLGTRLASLQKLEASARRSASRVAHQDPMP